MQEFLATVIVWILSWLSGSYIKKNNKKNYFITTPKIYLAVSLFLGFDLKIFPKWIIGGSVFTLLFFVCLFCCFFNCNYRPRCNNTSATCPFLTFWVHCVHLPLLVFIYIHTCTGCAALAQHWNLTGLWKCKSFKHLTPQQFSFNQFLPLICPIHTERQ